MMDTGFSSGFVSIIGSPNAGKSTLMNRIVGQKVSIVSPKAQTTRNRIMGVATRKDYQIVFLDTPGVAMPKNKLGEYMLKVAYESLNEVECALFITDAANGIRERDEAIIAKLREAKSPVIAAINKCDIADKEAIARARARLEKESFFRSIIEISAESGQGVNELEKAIAAYKTFRDSAVFTNKRLIIRDVQGVTGKKVEVFSLPYSSVIMWSSENAGHIDINSEIEIWTRIGCIKVCLRRGINIRRFDKIISTAVLSSIKE